MSSSGLIYAGIVGAWAVYLVPVWLRREEQLNAAREKARYATAIRTLGRPEHFEKRWAQDEELAATGTDGPVRAPSRAPSTNASKATKKTSPVAVPKPSASAAGQAAREAGPRPQSAAKTADASLPGKSGQRARKVAAPVQAGRQPGVVLAASQRSRRTVTARVTTAERGPVKHRGALLMRRRRVVAALFTLTTLGAVVSAVLGVAFIWAMLAPAALMSLYIVKVRRDERLRARERYRRRQAQLAAEQRRERERALGESPGARRDAERDTAVWRPAAEPGDYRRAANG